jgi:hypothetical protein
VGRPGNAYNTGIYIVGGNYSGWDWNGSTVTITGNPVSMRGGNPGTASNQPAYYYFNSGGGGSWTGGMGGYVTYAWNAPGAPNTPSVSRSSNGQSLYAATGGGSGRITYYNVALYGVTGWNANGTTFSVDQHGTYSVGSLAGNEDNSSTGGTATSYGICNAPTGQYATRSTTSAGTIGIGITTGPTYPGAGVTSWKMFRDGSLISNSGSYQINDTGLTRGQTYSYTFSATNSTGDGVQTSAVTAMAPGVPGAPSSISVGTKVGRTITIDHAQDANGYGNNVTEYRLQLSTDNGSTWKGWDNSTKTFTANGTYNVSSAGSFTYQLLTPALTYKWRVQGANSIGAGDLITTASGTFVGAGGKRWDGSNWNPTTVSKRHDGTNWVDLTTAKRFDGTNWVDLT